MSVRLRPDPRWQHVAGEFSELKAHAESWPVEPSTPRRVAEMLATARRLFCHSYFAYDFLPVSVTWSFLALEAALRDALGEGRGKRTPSLVTLVGKAQARGWFSEAESASLRSGAGLRDRLVHAEGHVNYTPGMADQMLRTAHAAIADLYRRATDGAGC